MSLWTLSYIISEWVIRLVMLWVITSRRRPKSSIAWLLLIFFLPWAGLVLYWLIGQNRLPRRRVGHHARLLEELQSLQTRFEGHSNIVNPELGPGQTSASVLAERLGSMPILGGNHVELISRTELVIDRIIADIDAAEHHVHLLFYIYANDNTGRRVTEALVRAVKRGVKCRLLVDGAGSRPTIKALGSHMVNQGIDLHVALPVNLFRRHMARIDLRNHRKLAIIDGHTAYAGSQNIVDASYGHKDLAWHDMMVRLSGPVVSELQVVFVGDWYYETGDLLDGVDIFPELPPAGEIPVQALPSGPSYPTENYQRMVVSALHAAREQVTITTPYFVPDEAFMQAIQVAVLRGVQVELIVPQRSDQLWVGAASRSYYEDLLDAGVKLYLYSDGLLHAKTMTIDDTLAFIGSSNFDIRSFALNFEINLVFYGSQVAGELRAIQKQFIENSVPLTSRYWKNRPRSQKVFQNIAKLLSPLL